MYDISQENHRRGVPYMTFSEASVVWKRIQHSKELSA
jgi:hypothetical protein